MPDKPSYEPKKSIKSPYSLDSKLNEAVLHHQHGRFDQARVIYEEIIKNFPKQPDAWHLLGVLAMQGKDYQKARELILHAIELAPQTAEYLYNMGMACANQNEFSEAVEWFEKAIGLKPSYHEAFYQAGLAYAKLNNIALAEKSFQQVVTLKPESLDAYFQLALLYRQAGDFSRSIEFFNQLIAKKPNVPELYLNLGYTQKLVGDLDAAIDSYSFALKLAPQEPMIYNMRGVVYVEKQDYDAGLADYQAALKLNPDFAEVYNNLGILFFESGKAGEGLEAFGRALSLQKDFIQPYINLATAYEKLHNYPAAIQYYDQALEIEPANPALYYQKALLLHKSQQFDQAVGIFSKCITLSPEYYQAMTARGTSYYEMGDYTAAKQDYLAALQLNPQDGDANTNLAFLELLQGNWQEGFERFEWRWLRHDCIGLKPQFEQPEWVGQLSLEGKSLLVYTEQGFGDTIQMVRYLPMLSSIGAKVTLQVDPQLVKLFKANLPAAIAVITQQDSLPNFDLHCSLMSLPFRFLTSPTTIPSTQRYLKANLQRRAYWEQSFGVKKKQRVGLVWETSHPDPVNNKRCLPLDMLLAILPPQFEYLSLQKVVNDQDQALLSQSKIRSVAAKLTDFNETAAVCDCMDLIISIDTSVAHLAGALGKPTWIMLPFVPDWRWLLNREDSPWYPSVRLFRQLQRGDWEHPLNQVVAALNSFHA